MANALYPMVFGTDIKRSTGTNQHTPHVGALLFASWNNGPDQIARLKALHLFRALWFGTGKTGLIDIALLSAS